MVRLVPMEPAEFEAYLENDIREYARSRVQAGYWTEAEALTRSRKEHRALLPDGLKSRYHHFHTIQDAESGQAVGALWFKTDLDSSRGSAFIFDLRISSEFRRRGYARAALLALEDLARNMGLHQLGLHIFAFNQGARALYESLGYSVASLNMLKDL